MVRYRFFYDKFLALILLCEIVAIIQYGSRFSVSLDWIEFVIFTMIFNANITTWVNGDYL